MDTESAEKTEGAVVSDNNGVGTVVSENNGDRGREAMVRLWVLGFIVCE